MLEASLSITFLSDWHLGSGLGDGAIADAVLNRDARGLPVLSGRAIKGALREGGWRLGLCRPDLAGLVDVIWGTESAARESNRPGRITVGPGELPADVRAWLLSLDPEERRDFVGDMTILRAQVALTPERTAVPHSLRSIECGSPGLSFESSVALDVPDAEAPWCAAYLTAVCAAVKSMGADRARGLGECRMAFAPKGQAPRVPTLPGPVPAYFSSLSGAEERR